MGCCSSAQKEPEPETADIQAGCQEIVETVEPEPVPTVVEVETPKKAMAAHGLIEPKAGLGTMTKERSDGTIEWTTYLSVPDDQHTMVQILSLNGLSGRVNAEKFDEVCEMNGYENTIGRFDDYFPDHRSKSDQSVLITPNRLLNSVVNSKYVKLQISDVFDDVGVDRRIIKLTGTREKDIYSALDLYVSTLSKESKKAVKTTGYYCQSIEDKHFSKVNAMNTGAQIMNEDYVQDNIYKRPGFTSEEHNEYVVFFPKDGDCGTGGDYLYTSKINSLKSKVKPKHRGIIDYKGKTYNVLSLMSNDEHAILVGRAAFENEKNSRLRGCLFDYRYCGDRDEASNYKLHKQLSVNNSIDSTNIASILLDELVNESCVRSFFGWPFGGATLLCENRTKRDLHVLDLPYCVSKIDSTLKKYYCSGKLIYKFRKDGQLVNVIRVWGQEEKINNLINELGEYVSIIDNAPVRTTILGC